MSEIRTRFAPSPTGYLHLGSARTALFNWAYARHHGGVFLLRIEDTDRERSTAESEAAVIDGLKWLGLDWDEGPFRQSDRADRHAEVIEQLLANGNAYRCVCTKDDLEARKQATLDAGGKWTYDGKCRDAGHGPDCGEHTVRLRLPTEGMLSFDDLVFGPSGQDASEIGDKIIRRSDGGALFHLAVVVDDIDMKISHVIRGADHHPNTPFQVALYQALGVDPPQFAHVPLIVGPSGKKLSKRRDPVSIDLFREQGYLPDGMRNWLIRLGWSHGDDEIFSREEIVKTFDLDGVGRASGQADPDKLLWVNEQHIKNADIDVLVEALSPHFEHHLGHVPERDDRLVLAIDLMRNRAKTLDQMAELATILLREEIDLRSEASAKAVKKHLKPAALPYVEDVVAALEKLDPGDWQETKLQSIFETVAASHGDIKLGKIAQPIRVGITGGAVSPGIYETMIAIGQKRCMDRLADALALMRDRRADALASGSS